MTFTVLVFFALVRFMLSRSERNVKYGEKRSAVLSVSADQRSSSAFDGFPTVKNPPHPKHPSVEASKQAASRYWAGMRHWSCRWTRQVSAAKVASEVGQVWRKLCQPTAHRKTLDSYRIQWNFDRFPCQASAWPSWVIKFGGLGCQLQRQGMRTVVLRRFLFTVCGYLDSELWCLNIGQNYWHKDDSGSCGIVTLSANCGKTRHRQINTNHKKQMASLLAFFPWQSPEYFFDAPSSNTGSLGPSHWHRGRASCSDTGLGTEGLSSAGEPQNDFHTRSTESGTWSQFEGCKSSHPSDVSSALN